MAVEMRGRTVTVRDLLGRSKELVICGDVDPGDRFPVVWVCDPEAFDTDAEGERRIPWPADDISIARDDA